MIYRTQVKIIADILKATKEYGYNDDCGTGVTTIIQSANLPYNRLAKILRELVTAGLLDEAAKGKILKYRISGKGEEFLSAYSQFETFAESFGLRL
jgi:predicted transcriptional regulator